MRCLFGFMLQSLNGMGSAQVVPSALSQACTHILTERPHCCAWLCRSCVWNGGMYTAFSYLETGGPCAGFCGVCFFRCAAPYLSHLHPPHLCSLMFLVFICLLTCILPHSFAISLVSPHVFSSLHIYPHLCGSSKHHGMKKWTRWVGMIRTANRGSVFLLVWLIIAPHSMFYMKLLSYWIQNSLYYTRVMNL